MSSHRRLPLSQRSLSPSSSVSCAVMGERLLVFHRLSSSRYAVVNGRRFGDTIVRATVLIHHVLAEITLGHESVVHGALCRLHDYADYMIMPSRVVRVALMRGWRGFTRLKTVSTRHNQRPSRKATSESGGQNRPGFVLGGAFFSSARSLIARSASR